MAFYGDEDDIWKCPKHPSKRRKSGICPLCLRDRLVTLCPHCANVRPCKCCSIFSVATAAAATTSSSSSSSSSFSRFSTDGSNARLSNLIDSEPAFRRSRSVAIPFLRSRSRFVADDRCEFSPSGSAKSSSSFWSLFKSNKSKKNRSQEEEGVDRVRVRVEELEKELRRRRTKEAAEVEEAMRRTVMIRSKSISVSSSVSNSKFVRTPSKGKGWHFPSPINVFRQSKVSKDERSPIHRG